MLLLFDDAPALPTVRSGARLYILSALTTMLTLLALPAAIERVMSALRVRM